MLLYFITLFLTSQVHCDVVYNNLPDFNKDIHENETFSHMKHDKIQRACENRTPICRSNDTVVCTVRNISDTMEYKQYNNSCYLFMSNMCEYPGKEFNIVTSTTCDEYLQARRHSLIPERESGYKKDANTTSTSSPGTSAEPALRGETPMSTIYDIDTAYDYHACPLSCPDAYSPVCVCVNRGFGLHFKFYTFVNHCEADRYYCRNWMEFSPPPDETENIQSSKLGWSYCGASRYLQFTRFAEASSSLGHYGWLEGDQRYSHIMEPHERKPGYG